MKVITTILEIRGLISNFKAENKTIGFVPTMGALHEGHGSLVLRAKNECDLVFVSIFVNPTQFNNLEDFNKYPITVENDVNYLNSLNADYLFLPSVDEIYSKDFIMPDYSIGKMNELMEGKFRPGHFDGVVKVVYRLFDIVSPTKAYFGLKDFQQLSIIKKMTEFFNLNIEIIPCTTIRDEKGLALSSRNLRLNASEKNKAYELYNTLIKAKNLSKVKLPHEIKQEITSDYLYSELKLEYFEIIDPNTFEPLENNWKNGAVACIVAYVGDIRLIDNMLIYEEG